MIVVSGFCVILAENVVVDFAAEEETVLCVVVVVEVDLVTISNVLVVLNRIVFVT